MALTIFNPNLIYPPQTPEGDAGPNAGFPLPFYSYGHWYANGLQQTYVNSEIPQRRSVPFRGIPMPNVFRKDASTCNGPLSAAV